MVKLILVRHGESIANKKGIYQGQTYDTGLTVRGKKQVELLAERLREFDIKTIFTSPLLRTKETAKILRKRLCVPMIVDGRIIEISHGKWEGRTKKLVESSYPDLISLWQKEPTRVQMPGGENLGQVGRRVKDFLDKLVKTYNNETIVIVGHDLIMRVMIAFILGLPLDNIWRFRLDNGGLTILGLDKNMEGRIIVLNQNDHLKQFLADIDSQAL